MKDYLIISGLSCSLSALGIYHFVGAGNPLYQATSSDQWAAAPLGAFSVLLFYCAWCVHSKSKASKSESLHTPEEENEEEESREVLPKEGDVTTWLKQWDKQTENTHH
jgi:hypothetical protein